MSLAQSATGKTGVAITVVQSTSTQPPAKVTASIHWPDTDAEVMEYSSEITWPDEEDDEVLQSGIED